MSALCATSPCDVLILLVVILPAGRIEATAGSEARASNSSMGIRARIARYRAKLLTTSPPSCSMRASRSSLTSARMSTSVLPSRSTSMVDLSCGRALTTASPRLFLISRTSFEPNLRSLRLQDALSA